MGKFTHYLVTRFNVKADGLGPEFISPDLRTADWEKDRLTLFRQYCAPSVNGQSSKNFTWLLFCDRHSTAALLDGINTSIAPAIAYQVLLVDDFTDMMSRLHDICKNADTAFVITSRLDNDDGIAIDYIQTVQAQFIPQHNTIINLLGGVHYQRDKHILTYMRFSANNSFISLIEARVENIQTVLGFKHLTPGNDKTIVNVRKPYAFWMTLHEHNAAPRINLSWPISASKAMKHYTIAPGHVRISPWQTLRYAINWFPKAAFRKMSFILRSRWQQLRQRPGQRLNQTTL